MGQTVEDAAKLYARTWRISTGHYPRRSTLGLLLDSLVPEIDNLPGYRGGTLLVDRDTGDIIATTFWDSLESLEAGQVRAHNAAAGTMVIADASASHVSVCDVLAVFPTPGIVDRELGPTQP